MRRPRLEDRGAARRLGRRELLASYETERRPIGLFNTREAADNYDKSGTIFAVPERSKKVAAGDAARAAVAALLPPKIKHFAPIGVHLGSATRTRRSSSMTARRRSPSIPCVHAECAARTTRAACLARAG